MKHSVKKKRVGTKSQVWKGYAKMTSGGLEKKDITRKKVGDSYRYVSKIKSKMAKQNPWIKSVMLARKELGITGFEIAKKGTPLYKTAKRIHNEM